jgi:hypothetical protein
MPKYSRATVTKAQAYTIYRGLKVTHDILTKANIPYWAVGGTLLGAVRHGGLIPWDDDGDICVMEEDVPRLRKLVATFASNGLELSDDQEDDEDVRCQKIKNACGWYVNPIKSKGVVLGTDIFIMKRRGNKIMYMDPQWHGDQGNKNCYFLKDQLFPLQPMRFGNFFIMVPNNPIEHLNRCYGDDWNSKSMMMYNHRLQKWEKGTKKTMKPDDFLTIPAPPDTCDHMVPPMVCLRGVVRSKSKSKATRRSKPKTTLRSKPVKKAKSKRKPVKKAKSKRKPVKKSKPKLRGKRR